MSGRAGTYCFPVAVSKAEKVKFSRKVYHNVRIKYILQEDAAQFGKRPSENACGGFQTAFFRIACLGIVFLCQNAPASAGVGRGDDTGVFQCLHQVGGSVVTDAQLPLQCGDGGLA